jgi:hypothetical protein
MATGYDPGDDTTGEHTVYTVVCNVNTSLFDKRLTIFQARYWVISGGHGQSCLLLHVSPLRHVCVVGALPRRLCKGDQGKNPSHREMHYENQTTGIWGEWYRRVNYRIYVYTQVRDVTDVPPTLEPGSQ